MAISPKMMWTLAAVGAGALMAGQRLSRRRDLPFFRGKRVLIAGGSRGLGLILARQLLHSGAQVAICARDGEELKQAVNELDQIGEIRAETCDVTDQDQVRAMIARLLQEWGRIDVLINNAGVIQAGPLEEMTIDDYELTMQTHFYGALHAIEAVLPDMRQRREGRIVNISSIGGLISVPHLVPYCASKFALVGYSLGIRNELAKDNIVVTTVCPGLMRTGSPRNALFKGRHRAEYALFKISDSLPIISMNADRAAELTLRACQSGQALAVFGVPMRVAATFNAMFPGITSALLSGVNRFLPGPGGIGKRPARGAESESAFSQSVLTQLTDRAAQENNEIPGDSLSYGT